MTNVKTEIAFSAPFVIAPEKTKYFGADLTRYGEALYANYYDIPKNEAEEDFPSWYEEPNCDRGSEGSEGSVSRRH